MALKETLQHLGTETNNPCVSISMNTHRARPKTEQDKILLKNLLKEAHDRVSKEYDKKLVDSLLKRISSIKEKIDLNANLDSLHIFLSNDTEEIVKSPWEAASNRVNTEDNYAKLMQVADKPNAYHGYVSVSYNKDTPHQVVKDTWKLIEKLQSERRGETIEEVKRAISQGNVITDLQEIYRAAIIGRGDVLVVHQNFRQPVMMNDDDSFELIDDPATPGAIDEEIKELGKIAMKTRY